MRNANPNAGCLDHGLPVALDPFRLKFDVSAFDQRRDGIDNCTQLASADSRDLFERFALTKQLKGFDRWRSFLLRTS